MIICAIFVASFSLFWVVQNTFAENHYRQQRIIETTLLNSMVSAFKARGEQGAKDILQEWRDHPISRNVFMIAGDDDRDILGRRLDSRLIELARQNARKNPSSDMMHIE